MKIFSKRVAEKRCAGFTMVEVALGILILAILAVAVPSALRHPRQLLLTASHKQAAVLVANEALEDAMSWGYGNTNLVPGPLGDLSDRYAMHGRVLSGEREVVDLGGGIQLVTIFVDYPVGNSQASIILETLISP